LQPASASFIDDLFGPNYETYQNSTYNVKVDYPKDWEYFHPEIDKKTEPEQIFQVMFTTPYESGNPDPGGSVSVDIEDINKLKPTTTLEQYKNRVMKNLKEAGKDVKGLSLSTTTLDGETAYRIEEQMWMLDHWMKDISIFSVKDGKLYQISSLIRPEEMDKYSEAIENMFKSVKFH